MFRHSQQRLIDPENENKMGAETNVWPQHVQEMDKILIETKVILITLCEMNFENLKKRMCCLYEQIIYSNDIFSY